MVYWTRLWISWDCCDTGIDNSSGTTWISETTTCRMPEKARTKWCRRRGRDLEWKRSWFGWSFGRCLGSCIYIFRHMATANCSLFTVPSFGITSRAWWVPGKPFGDLLDDLFRILADGFVWYCFVKCYHVSIMTSLWFLSRGKLVLFIGSQSSIWLPIPPLFKHGFHEAGFFFHIPAMKRKHSIGGFFKLLVSLLQPFQSFCFSHFGMLGCNTTRVNNFHSTMWVSSRNPSFLR